jgi:Bacterial Ig domain
MPEFRRRFSLEMLSLEERLTPAYNPQVVFDYLNSQAIQGAGNPNATGGIFRSWANTGPQSDPNQRVVDPREAGYAVQGLLNSNLGNSATNLDIARNYILWYLNNVNATDFTIEQQWYRNDGSFVRTTSTTGQDASAGVFLQTLWLYLQKGGDSGIITSGIYQQRFSGVIQLLLRLQQGDGLTTSFVGSTDRLLTNNSEAYSGLSAASRILAEVFNQNTLAAQYEEAAKRLRDGIQLSMYDTNTGGYGWRKVGTGQPDLNDDPTNPWQSSVARIWPAIHGVDDPRGPRSTAELNRINTNWTGADSWINTFVDNINLPWASMGYASHLVSGVPTDGNAHNDWIYDTFFTTPTQPQLNFFTDDAGWMLRVAGATNRAPTGTPATAITLDQGTSATFTIAGLDPDNTPVRYSIVGRPGNGTVTTTAANGRTIYTTNTEFVYTPTFNFSGTDTVQFQVSDGEFNSQFVNVTFTVNPLPVVPPVPPTVPPGLPVIPGVPPVIPPVVVPGPPGVPPTVVIPPVPPPPPLPALRLNDVVVTSAEPSNAITIITADGTLRNRPVVFDTIIPGGVKGTITTANNTPYLLVGTGSGVTTQVRGVNGATNAILFRINPYEASFQGGVFVSSGDVTGDGTPDILVSPDQGGGPRVRIYDGATLAPVVDFFGIQDPAFRGGARITTGNFNRDQYADVVVAAGVGGGPRITIWDGFELSRGRFVQLANFFAFEPGLRDGVYVDAGQTTQPRFGSPETQGIDDLVVGAGPGGGPRVTVFSGYELTQNTRVRLQDFFAGNPNERGGVSVAVKPFNGFLPADYPRMSDTIVVGQGAGGTVRKMITYFGGGELDSLEPLDGNVSGIFVG